MSVSWKPKKPQALTKKLIQAAINMQAPTDAPQSLYVRKKPRKFVSDGVEDVGDVGEK